MSQIVLHWLSVIIILGMFFLGDFMVGLDYYHPWYQTAPYWHKSVGLLFFVLIVIRLMVRIVFSSPRHLDSHQRWERVAASITHGALYALIFTICISGYLISTADGRSISVFTWFEVPATIHDIDLQEELAGTVHEWAVYIMLALAGIHAAAALKHHFIDRDDTLLRMLGCRLRANAKSKNEIK